MTQLQPTPTSATPHTNGVASLDTRAAVGTAPEWLDGGELAVLLRTLSTAGCCGILALDADSVIRYAQGDVFDPALGTSKGVGTAIERLFRPELARERQDAFAQLARQRVPSTILVDMVRGRELWWVSTPVYRGNELRGLAAVGMHPHADAKPTPEAPEMRRLRYVLSAGPLAKLTLGELEVLRLLAMGRRREEIAEDLRRTVKAVERRRTTLGRKLEAEHAGELVMVGLSAGLHRMSHPELVRFAEANCGPNAPETGIASASA